MKLILQKTFWIALVGLFCLGGTTLKAQTNVVPDDVEFQVLKNIYDSLGGTGWITKTNWPTAGNWPATATNATFKTWTGVTVANGDVTAIAFGNNNLKGIIPRTIGRLTALQNITINSNAQLTSDIPSSIGALTNLTTLSFLQNKLSGQIPTSIGSLTKLTSLVLEGNSLTGTIPSQLGQLTNLTSLDLTLNGLTGDIPDLSQLTNLVGLGLRSNALNAGPIPTWISGLTKLSTLDLATTQRTGAIPDWIGNLTNLTNLSLGSNQLSGTIPSSICNLTKLTQLSLWFNQLSGTLPDCIGSFTNLGSLYLSNNQFTGSIPSSYGNLKNLTLLYLTNNQLTGVIPSTFGGLSKVAAISLQSNQLTGSIPDALGNLTNLTSLTLNYNQLSGMIPASLGNLTKLTTLYLSNNQLTGSIPDSFGNLVNLTLFYVSTNQLSGSLPSSLGNLSKVQNFIVNNNQFTGSIPPSFSGLTSVVAFYAYNNKFSGALPAFSWPKLTALMVDTNSLSGTFPDVSGLPLLNTLTASNNSFTGIHPSVLNLSSVVNINFQNNELTTNLPSFTSQVNKANLTLVLSNNRLDFSQLEPLSGAGIKAVTLTPQKNIADVNYVTPATGAQLVIPARPLTANTTMVWEKQANGSWTTPTNANQDNTLATYARTTFATADEGVYHWKTTSTKFSGVTIMSDPINVKVPQRVALDNFAFQYKYDGRKRMTAKKVPGADWVYMVYDNRDRLVLTQDGNQRLLNQWTFTKYDALNRPVMTGIYTYGSAIDQVGMQGVVNNYYTNLTASQAWYESFTGTGNIHGYDNKSFPTLTDPSTCLTITYYDNYSFLTNDAVLYGYVPNDVASQTENGILYKQPDAAFVNVIGQVTGTKVKALDGNIYWLKTVNYYDDRYRLIQTIADQQRNNQERTTTIYDFTGKVLASKNSVVANMPTWQNVTNLNVTINSLFPTFSSASWQSGASSREQLPANQDGWVEASIVMNSPGGNNYVAIGLSQTDGSTSYTSIDYALVQMNGGLYVMEGGVQRTGGFTIYAGDVIRVERVGFTINYRKNGTILKSTTISSAPAMIFDNSFEWQPSILLNPRASFTTKTINSVARHFDYDHAGRLVNTWHQTETNAEVLLAHNEYNELGQLVDKKLYSTDNGNTFKQSEDYRYNIRGWLTSINNSQLVADGGATNDDTNDLFGMNLSYNDMVAGINNTPQFNGNISAMKWSKNQALGTIKDIGYSYTYDPMNRITAASFLNNNAGTWAASNAFAENGFSYDLNGNIKKLTRTDQNGGIQDQLKYDYGSGNTQSNQLLSVTDGGDISSGFIDGNQAGADYTYDATGSMNVDKNKGITAITYNYLHLPQQVTKSTGDNIKYIYDATGKKLSQQVYNTNGVLQKKVDYAGEYYYENDVLQMINHEEGRVLLSQRLPIYQNLGATLDGVTATSGTGAMAAVDNINNQDYIVVTSTNTATGNGAYPIGGTLTVQPGEQYLYRAKGYYTGTAPVGFLIKGLSSGTVVNIASGTETLPAGATSENWTELLVTVPAGVTSLTGGLVWNLSANGQSFYINDFEIVKVVSSPPEYQYHLKDHLGNVRTTFTTKDDIQTNTATLESANVGAEQGEFLRYDDVRRINSTLFDHTYDVQPSPDGSAYAQRLSGSANEKNGLEKSLSVMPGDKIDMEVYAKYVDPNHVDPGAAGQALLTLLANAGSGAAGTVIDGASYAINGAQAFPFAGLISYNNDNSTAPKAHLNWLIFDRNYTFVDGGYVQMTGAGREDGTNVAHDYLSHELTITQPGYVYIYLSNDSPTPVEVYFDDFKVTHTKSPVVQTDDYYPFGLTFNSYQRENSLINRYLFNGKELQTDLNLNLEDFGARMYDRALVRWWVVDPLSEKMRRWSPYDYAFDNPIRFIDPEGMAPQSATGGACGDQPCPNDSPAKYQPSQATQERFAQAKENLDKVFDGKIELSGKLYGVDGKVQAGPVKFEGSASAAKITGKLSPNGVEIKGGTLNVSGSAKFASAEAKGSFSAAETKFTINQDGVKSDTEAFKTKGELTLGANGFNMNADNSTKVGIGASISVLKVEGSVNIGAAIKGIGNLVDAGLSYAADLWKNSIKF